MLRVFLAILTVFVSSLFADEYVVYNDDTKEFESINEIFSKEVMDNAWFKMKENILNNFQIKEIKNEQVQRCFLEDFKYLKQKNKYLTRSTLNILNNWAKNLQNPVKKIDDFSIDILTDEIKQKLLLEAMRVRTYAYAPYSKFHVGAAILTKNGDIYSGCNFENAAYGNTICAERSAIAGVVSNTNRGFSLQKNRDIVAIAIVLRGGIGSPCGCCRQALYEFNPNMLVIMSDIDFKTVEEKYLHEILPYGFGPLSIESAIVD